MNLWVNAKSQLSKVRTIDYARLSSPCLSDSEILQLRHWAMENNLRMYPSRPRTRQSYGEQESLKLGQGLEFEHSRAYLSGDEKKHINWRLSARMPELQVKQFNEFQQSKVHVFVDATASMRFGSRVRSKIAQAVRSALYVSHLAQLRKSQVFARIIQHDMRKSVVSDYRDIEAYFNRAYPPVSTQSPASTLSLWLESINSENLRNDLLVIISDFHFLHALNDIEFNQFLRVLNASAILAVRVCDPLEKRLPAQGIYTLSSQDNANRYEFDLNDEQLQHGFEKIFDDYNRDIKHRLRLCFTENLEILCSHERVDDALHDSLATFL